MLLQLSDHVLGGFGDESHVGEPDLGLVTRHFATLDQVPYEDDGGGGT